MKLFKNIGGNNFKLINEYSTPENEHVSLIGWDDLCELANNAEFNTPIGIIDFWSLIGYFGLTMDDAENQSVNFFKFMITISKHVVDYHKKFGEHIELKNLEDLKNEWLTEKNKNN